VLINELADGEIASDIVDVYPHAKEKSQVNLKYQFLKKLSGKEYHPEDVKKILTSLGFEIRLEGTDYLSVSVPYHKPDISLPADLVEEIMRIDGYDNIEIPSTISISPSTDKNYYAALFKEKVSNYLSSIGFNEILTNSITNSAYFTEAEIADAVRMVNNLSAELNVMRPSMLQTGLESIAYNINRKNNNLSFFEFGKTYKTSGVGKYFENEHLCLYTAGTIAENSWKLNSTKADIYYLKGICQKIFNNLNSEIHEFTINESSKFTHQLSGRLNGQVVLQIGEIRPKLLQSFAIKQPVFYADFDWDTIMTLLENNNKIEFKEIPRQLPVHRDLALVVNKLLPYEEVEKAINSVNLSKLRDIRLFDIFESEKFGADKKSLALSFVFLDKEKTLTDEEVEDMMNKIILTLENRLKAEIRK
jgi:phenylalanyl-tRNA synthetase beta chain